MFIVLKQGTCLDDFLMRFVEAMDENGAAKSIQILQAVTVFFFELDPGRRFRLE
jgi:hypothetical protein